MNENTTDIKHIIAVASGKGGVGKSTTAVNLAFALAASGAQVGILDADIYGPNVPKMLGIEDQKPEIKPPKRFVPIVAYGLSVMSLGLLMGPQTPMIWRGPMASKAVEQLLRDTEWPCLDYLILDLPPGTGDIHLTLVKKAALRGAVIVTTPQAVALMDARKGVEMFRKTAVPILGVVENMGPHTCTACGHQEAVFGGEGGQSISEAYKVPFLGSIPLDARIPLHMERGLPLMQAEPDGTLGIAYQGIAKRIVDILS